MNILYINHYAGSPEMGMEFRPYYLAREWTRMGHKVTMAAATYSHLRRKNPDICEDFTVQNIDGIDYMWIKTGTYEGNGLSRAKTMISFLWKLYKKSKWIVSEFKPDVIICSSTYPLDTYIGQRIRKISNKRVKLIHEVHDMWPSTLTEIGGMSKFHPFVVAMQIGENSAYKNSDKVVSLPPLALSYMMKHGLKKDKFIHIPNGVVEEEWKGHVQIPKAMECRLKEIKNKNKFIVGYIGGHALSNSLDDIVETANRMKTENVHFILVGDGIEKARLIKKSKNLRLNNIDFFSAVEKAMIPDLLNNFNCGFISALPSPLYRFGTCMNKIFDYMAAGLPIVCAITTPRSQVSDSKCGICVDSGDIDGIVSAIQKLRNMKPTEIEDMSNRGRTAVENQYLYSILAKKFIKIM